MQNYGRCKINLRYEMSVLCRQSDNDKNSIRSLEQQLEAFAGSGPGFDHIRIGLSIAILLWHSFSVTYGLNYAELLPPFPIPPLLSAFLPMFFGLSGFLVMGSALRVEGL